MAEVVAKTGVKKEPGYLYFVTKTGDVGRSKMARGKGSKKGPIETVAKAGVKKESGYLYFITGEGHIGRAKMARKGKK